MLSRRERARSTNFSAVLPQHNVAVAFVFGLKIIVLRGKSGGTSLAFVHCHIQVSGKRSDVHSHRQ